jgi:23S rRNA (uracil1939-C5)-methyltransferase
MNKVFTMTAEGIAHDGAAKGQHEGEIVRVHGMLPGEVAIVDTHKKHGLLIGVIKEMITASPSRKTPEELHYLSCSPWQIADYALQVGMKHDMLSSLFSYYDDSPDPSFVTAQKFYGYRTKVEFSFTDRDGDLTIPLQLAFHERGGGYRRLALSEGCALVSSNMNRVALLLVAKLRDIGYTTKELKTLVVRESKSTGKLLAILYVKALALPEFSVDDIDGLSGFIVFHSTEKSPASVPTKELWRVGDDVLHEKILGTDIAYSWDSFFQNNIPVFEEAMTAMSAAVPTDANVLELYSGVGTIGIILAKRARHVHGVEVVLGAVESAKRNADMARLVNYVSECIPAEKMDARLLEKRDVLVLDPPRSGLHQKVIAMIIEKRPPKIVYLSCNPETQARDYALLKELYSIESIVGYDFYPNTPHLESLIILNLRTS